METSISSSSSPKRSSSNSNLGLILFVFLLLVGPLSLFFLYSPFSYNPFFFSSYTNHHNTSSNWTDELGHALERVAMENKTVIIAVVNKAYVEHHQQANTNMLDIFLESFWLGKGTRQLLDHLLLVAVDQMAYDRCEFRGLNCYKLETDGVDFGGEKVYMSEEFIKMMWRRTEFLLDVLKRGYSFIFTDTDVMWLRDPFIKLSNNTTLDLQISTDRFNGDPTSQNNLINTGFYYIKSNNKTIALFDKWYGLKGNSTGKKEQDVLLDLLREGIFRQLGLHVRFLDTLFFSGFCQDSKDMEGVTTVHANCCRTIGAKLMDLSAVLRDWENYNGYKARKDFNATSNFHWTSHIGCQNSWGKLIKL